MSVNIDIVTNLSQLFSVIDQKVDAAIGNKVNDALNAALQPGGSIKNAIDNAVAGLGGGGGSGGTGGTGGGTVTPPAPPPPQFVSKGRTPQPVGDHLVTVWILTCNPLIMQISWIATAGADPSDIVQFRFKMNNASNIIVTSSTNVRSGFSTIGSLSYSSAVAPESSYGIYMPSGNYHYIQQIDIWSEYGYT
jgi:hypothetical protein